VIKPKGYWIAAITIREREGYDAYQAAVRQAIEPYGGRYVVRGGRAQVTEGDPRPRAVVIEFDDYETALACYHSAAFGEAIAMRQRLAETDFIVVEGWDGRY
jgi:uncharacterized protein (DUF1330 family)